MKIVIGFWAAMIAGVLLQEFAPVWVQFAAAFVAVGVTLVYPLIVDRA